MESFESSTLAEQQKLKEAEEIKRQEYEAYQEELKEYEKLGALKFQKVVFAVERLKFKVLKKICPNFLSYFDKYIDWKKENKIKAVKNTIEKREKISKKTPHLLKYYDKLESFKRKQKLRKEESIESVRRKVKVSHPKVLEFYDKYLKEISPYKGLSPEEQIDTAIYLAKISKMAMRKEFYQEENANYHMNPKSPTTMKKYLEWNKKIHVRGIMGNVAVILASLVALITGFTPALPIIAIELVSLGINFECINIQNYNLCRFKMKEDVLKKIEQRNMEKNIKKYGEAAKVIYKSLEENENLPSFTQIISNITDIEQAKQLRELLKQAQLERNLQMNRRNKR